MPAQASSKVLAPGELGSHFCVYSVTTMEKTDLDWMLDAIELSKQCPAAETFNVGCLVLNAEGKLVSTGFSRERDGGAHAEETALAKADERLIVVGGGVLYSTLEPCHPRLSGKTSCTQHIINRKLRKVVFGAQEPLYFVQCKGVETLMKHGIEVVYLAEVEHLVREVNKHIFDKLPNI